MLVLKAFIILEGLPVPSLEPIVVRCEASTSVSWSGEDTVVCRETAEAFPPSQTVFPLSATFLIGGNAAAEKGVTAVAGFARPPFIFSFWFRQHVTDAQNVLVDFC